MSCRYDEKVVIKMVPYISQTTSFPNDLASEERGWGISKYKTKLRGQATLHNSSKSSEHRREIITNRMKVERVISFEAALSSTFPCCEFFETFNWRGRFKQSSPK